MKIGKKKFDKVGEIISDWAVEHGQGTDATDDLELENNILSALGIEYDRDLK